MPYLKLFFTQPGIVENTIALYRLIVLKKRWDVFWFPLSVLILLMYLSKKSDKTSCVNLRQCIISYRRTGLTIYQILKQFIKMKNISILWSCHIFNTKILKATSMSQMEVWWCGGLSLNISFNKIKTDGCSPNHLTPNQF